MRCITHLRPACTCIAQRDLFQLYRQVLAYSFGQASDGNTGFFVEVDIVISPPNTPVYVAHDRGEELQQRLEQLPEVVRAHVHIDFEVAHPATAEHLA